MSLKFDQGKDNFSFISFFKKIFKECCYEIYDNVITSHIFFCCVVKFVEWYNYKGTGSQFKHVTLRKHNSEVITQLCITHAGYLQFIILSCNQIEYISPP
jgi:hypothetical protein